MASRRRTILMAIGIPLFVLLTVLSVIGLIYYRQLTQTRKLMRPMVTQQLEKNLYVCRAAWFNNFFLFKTDCGLVAFDTGLYPEVTRRELAKLGFRPEDVKAVFLTHSDQEHAGGAINFPNAKIYIGKDEVQMIDGTTGRVPWPLSIVYYNELKVPYETLEDGQVVDVCGLKVKTVFCPGHTPGTVVYIVGDKLIAGDSMGLKDGRIVGFNEYLFVNMDVERMNRSIRDILAKLPGITQILTMHFGMTSDVDKAFENWRRKR
ncbi:MAG: MBL fold metallo-hydrolase [Spirochaetes bacterium]|nr:MBL fold metallo-hydrolase [Spirochaetota bacterium]